MSNTLAQFCRRTTLALLVPALAALAAPAAAQMQTVDPSQQIDGDLEGEQVERVEPGSGGNYEPAEPTTRYDTTPQIDYEDSVADAGLPGDAADPAANSSTIPAPQPSSTTYAEDDLIGAAEGLFGRGAEGLARIIQDILSDQGEPNAYIVGREGGGAFVLGVRYGSGTLYHAVEGNMPVYWTGPSIGIDVGANAGNTFVLVYNLYDSDELYQRFPAGEGQLYLVGGFNASYVRRGDIVLIPIRVGAGLRAGINAGYLRFSRNQRWLPF